MGDKDQSTKTIPADAAEPTAEQVKQLEEWLHAHNSQSLFSPFRIDPVLTTILHQQQPAQQTPQEAPRSVVFAVPVAGQKDNSGQDSKGQGSATRLPFPSSETVGAKPGWGEQTVNRLPGEGSFSEFVRYGFPLAKEGLAETGKMVALPFAWAGKVMAHPLDPIEGLNEAQKLKYRWFPNAPKTWSESGHQASEMALRPLRELAGERQPNVSVMEQEELSKIGPGFAAYQQPWWRRTEMGMSAFMGGNPDAARQHAANAWVARSQGDEKTANRETGRAVAELAAKPLATWARLSASYKAYSTLKPELFNYFLGPQAGAGHAGGQGYGQQPRSLPSVMLPATADPSRIAKPSKVFCNRVMTYSAPEIRVTGEIYRERQHDQCEYSRLISDICFSFARV